MPPVRIPAYLKKGMVAMKKTRLGTVFFGVLLIFIGLGYLYESMGFGSFNIFFKGWWLVLIILLVVFDMVRSRVKPIGCLIVALCVWELLYRYHVIPRGVSLSVIFALLLIGWGISVIIGGKSTAGNKVCFFKTQTYSAAGQAIELVQCILGNCIVDLRNGTYADGQALKVQCILGSVEVVAPPDLKVTPVCGGNVLGSFSDTTKPAVSGKEIILDYRIVLGNIQLRGEEESL